MADRMVNDPSKLARLLALAQRAGTPHHAPGTSPQAQGFHPMEGPTNMNVPGDWEKTPYELGFMPMEEPPPSPRDHLAPDDKYDFAYHPERATLAAILSKTMLPPGLREKAEQAYAKSLGQ